jgi:hypothetical protein
MWKGIVGKSFSPEAFREYVAGLSFQGWRPEFVVLHNTGIPTLSQRPQGLTREHIKGLESYYRDDMGWSAGPHLFVDDRQIWAFTPLTTPGVHSPSWNSRSLGVEMLGDYDREEFDSGRGLAVQQNAVAAVAILSAALALPPDTMRLHREDPETKHHCPGDRVDKVAFVQAVKDYSTTGELRENSASPQTQILTPEEKRTEKTGDLQAALDFVLEDNIEGGYINNPADPGGETNFGICKRSYPDVDIKNLTRDGAKAIYAREYWAPIHGDELPEPVALVAFDCAVNQGVGTAVKVLQEALANQGYLPDDAVDGRLGPQTLEALKPADSLWLATDMIFLRLGRYLDLKTWGNFGKGWARRMQLLYYQIRSA